MFSSVKQTSVRLSFQTGVSLADFPAFRHDQGTMKHTPTLIRPLLLIVLVAFTAFSAYVTYEAGYWSAFPPFTDLNTTQIFCDLTVALNLVFFLLYLRVRQLGLPLWPLVVAGVATVFVGSISPLVYLVLNPRVYRSR